MTNFARLLLLLTFSAMIYAVVGCESADSGNNSLTTGDTTSAEFQFVQDMVAEGALDNIGYSLDMAFDLIDMIPGGQAIPLNFKTGADTSLVLSHEYSYSNGWHIFDFSASFSDGFDSTVIEGIDSIQTLVNNDPVQVPDSTINGIKIRSHYAFENSFFGSGSADHSLDISAPSFDSGQTVTVAGSGLDELDMYFEDSTSVCSLMVSNSMDIDDVSFILESEEECPFAGSIDMSSSIDLGCSGDGSEFESLNIAGTWIVSATFNGTSQTIVFSDGTTTWTVTESCGGSSASPIASFKLR